MTIISDANFPSEKDPRILTFSLGLFLIGIIVVLVWARSVHYLLFHTLAEIIAIVVSLSIFSLTWASRRHLKNGYLVILGSAYITIGIVDIFHALTFKGMNLLPGVTTNHPTQFWLTARFIEAVALVVAPLFIQRTPRFTLAALAFAIPGVLGCIAVLNGVLPKTFIEGVGLTQFKVVSEYVIILLLLTAQIMLWNRRKEFAPQVFRLLSGSLLLAIATELCFVHYVGFYDFVNELGHFFRFLSVVLAYLALVVTGVRRPTEILYRQLQESEDHFRKLYQTTPAILHSIDADGKLISVSDHWLSTFGYTKDEVIGKNSSEFLTEESRRFAVEEVLPEFFRTGLCHDIPYQFVTKDGRILDMLLSATVERDSDNCINKSLSVMTDVTVRNRIEAELMESELRFRGAFQTATHGMALKSIEGKFVKVNPALCTMLGYNEADLLTTDFQTITHPDDLAADLSYVHDLLEGKIDTYQMEKRYFHKTGRIVWILLSVSLVRKKDGAPVHFVAQMQDITERKQMENEVHRMAFYDHLTNLPNRSLLSDRISQAMAASKRSGCYGALMFLDLDNFKPLNDTYGHDVGDLLLVEVAGRLTSCVRDVDTVARVGGDEFVVMISSLNLDKIASTTQAKVIAEKISAAIAEPYVLIIKEKGKAKETVKHHCTASIGVAMFIDHEEAPKDVLKSADRAMYQAKEAGRNLIRFCD